MISHRVILTLLSKLGVYFMKRGLIQLLSRFKEKLNVSARKTDNYKGNHHSISICLFAFMQSVFLDIFIKYIKCCVKPTK